MSSNLIRGQTLRFTFDDGPMAMKTFEHVFDPSGTVAFHMIGGAKRHETQGPKPKYEVAMIRDDVAVVSYVGTGGYALTTVLDFKTKKLVAFASNDKGVSVQHGTFEVGSAPTRASTHS